MKNLRNIIAGCFAVFMCVNLLAAACFRYMDHDYAHAAWHLALAIGCWIAIRKEDSR
jgi:hypothetical protein